MKVALIDSCGVWAGAVAATRFSSTERGIERCEPLPDPTGHGAHIARILSAQERGGDARRPLLLLAQVFSGPAPATAAAVAAAIDWACTQGAELIHLSLGLHADRAVLSRAVAEALGARVLLVAAAPARGATVFPAAYAGVIAATGDARCGPRELSVLGPRLFGGCPRFIADPLEQAKALTPRGGASAGAAWVSRAILDLPADARACVVERLSARARYFGRERRADSTSEPTG